VSSKWKNALTNLLEGDDIVSTSEQHSEKFIRELLELTTLVKILYLRYSAILDIVKSLIQRNLDRVK